MQTAIIALGSNRRFARQSPAQVVLNAGVAVATLGQGARHSSLYRSAAWPNPSAPAYVNAVMTLDCALAPDALLAALHAVEAGFGRLRSDLPAERYAPRTLDLDLIDYGGTVRDRAGSGPILPHPRAAERAFVLAPLAEIAPRWRHPVTGEAVGTLLAATTDRAVRLPFTG